MEPNTTNGVLTKKFRNEKPQRSFSVWLMELSLKVKNPTLKNALISFASTTNSFVGLIIFNILALPLIMFIIIESESDVYDVTEYSVIFSLIGMFSLFIALGAGVFLPFAFFRHNHVKSRVDMNLGLPLSTKQRFFSNYIAGLATYLIPYIIGLAIALGEVVFANLADESFAVESELKMAISVLCLVPIGMLLAYTVSTFVCCVCGSAVENFIYTILINGVLPLSTYILTTILPLTNLYGRTFWSEYANTEFTMATSPVGNAIFLVIRLSGEMPFNTLAWALGSLATTAVFLVGAFLLYKKRRAEDVGTPFIFMSIYNGLMALMLVCCLSVSFIDENFEVFFPMLFVSAVIFGVLETIRNRGFKKIVSSAWRFVVLVVIALAINTSVVATKGFGFETRIPSPATVKSVSINYSGFFEEYPLTYNMFNEKGGTYTDDKSIETIIKFHETLVKRFKDSGLDAYEYDERLTNDTSYDTRYPTFQYDSERSFIEITYTTITGNKILRGYIVKQEDLLMLSSLKNKPEFSKEFFNNVDFNVYTSDGIEDNNETTIVTFSKLKNMQRSYTVSRSQLKSLQDAYAKDMQDMTEDEYYKPDIYCFLWNAYGDQIPVRSTFTNTIGVMNKFGIEVVDLDKDANSFLAAIEPNSEEDPTAGGFTVDEWNSLDNTNDTFARVKTVNSDGSFSVGGISVYGKSLDGWYYYDIDGNVYRITDDGYFVKIDPNFIEATFNDYHDKVFGTDDVYIVASGHIVTDYDYSSAPTDVYNTPSSGEEGYDIAYPGVQYLPYSTEENLTPTLIQYKVDKKTVFLKNKTSPYKRYFDTNPDNAVPTEKTLSAQDVLSLIQTAQPYYFSDQIEDKFAYFLDFNGQLFYITDTAFAEDLFKR
jgi:hypothetical protein